MTMHCRISALRDIEGSVREASTKLWGLTVADPETATAASEQAGTPATPGSIRALYQQLDKIAGQIEAIVNEEL